MLFHELHDHLKDRASLAPSFIELPELSQRLENHVFVSEGAKVLKNARRNPFPAVPDPSSLPEEDKRLAEAAREVLALPDPEIKENASFRFHVFRPEGEEPRKAVILLHGFNERGWTKYLPWASRIAEKTGAAVILFPIAFHMNRSPALWKDAHRMRLVSTLRKKLHPEIVHSTLSNAAVSLRMTHDPWRFFWSGLESLFDVNQLAAEILAGKIPGIAKDAQIDLFTYSIGSFLGEIVLMTNEKGLFSGSKLCCFCGGAVYERLCPVSKFIMDSEAAQSLRSALVENLDAHIENNPALANYLSDGATVAGGNFLSLLKRSRRAEDREKKFKDLASRIYAVALKEDQVVPAADVSETLKGAKGDTGVRVDVLSPSHRYRHEDPFPVAEKDFREVDQSFDEIFNAFADFLNY
ncbi:MAG: DUF6051 family protein [Deltaproteobacteria bacterium]|jgi:hypothetical protein|nr:DUF6051 family protein [Deltaproteobacteria bacterium]